MWLTAVCMGKVGIGNRHTFLLRLVENTVRFLARALHRSESDRLASWG
jgi:hypothetical protein